MKKLLSVGIVFIILFLSGCSFAGNYYEDGKKAFKRGDYEQAADDFSKAIASNHNRAQYYVDYGLSLIALGKYEESLTQFDKAYMNKDMAVIRKNNKRALRGKGIAYYKLNEYEKAVAELKAALEIDELAELNMDILYYMGSIYRVSGAFDKAVDAYTEIIQNDKDDALAYAERAYCYCSLGSFKKSLTDYNKAISRDPDNFEYYFGKFNLLMDIKDTAGAKEVLAKASDIKVKTDEDKYNMAKLHYYQENYGAALTELENSYTSGFYEAYYYVGEIYRIQKNYTKASYYYETYINKGNTDSPRVYNQIAVCLMKTGDYKKALDYLDTGIKFKDTSTLRVLKKNEIIACEKIGDYDAAATKMKAYLAAYQEDEAATREAEFINTRLAK